MDEMLVLIFLIGSIVGFIPGAIYVWWKKRAIDRSMDRLWHECGQVRALAESCAAALQIEQWEAQMAEFMEDGR